MTATEEVILKELDNINSKYKFNYVFSNFLFAWSALSVPFFICTNLLTQTWHTNFSLSRGVRLIANCSWIKSPRLMLDLGKLEHSPRLLYVFPCLMNCFPQLTQIVSILWPYSNACTSFDRVSRQIEKSYTTEKIDYYKRLVFHGVYGILFSAVSIRQRLPALLLCHWKYVWIFFLFFCSFESIFTTLNAWIW